MSGWRFWRREPSAAERSLAALQEAAAAPPPPAPPAVDPELAALEARASEADEHMTEVTGRIEALLAATPTDERGAFMLEVTTVSALADGTVRVSGGASDGTVAVGDLVGLVLLPPGAAESWSADSGALDPNDVAAMSQHLETLMRTSAGSATVVEWHPDEPALVLSGVDPAVVTVGSMVTR